jgi:hypothetical protein
MASGAARRAEKTARARSSGKHAPNFSSFITRSGTEILRLPSSTVCSARITASPSDVAIATLKLSVVLTPSFPLDRLAARTAFARPPAKVQTRTSSPLSTIGNDLPSRNDRSSRIPARATPARRDRATPVSPAPRPARLLGRVRREEREPSRTSGSALARRQAQRSPRAATPQCSQSHRARPTLGWRGPALAVRAYERHA